MFLRRLAWPHSLLYLSLAMAACGPSSGDQSPPVQVDMASLRAAMDRPQPSAPQIAKALRSSDAKWAVSLLASLHCAPGDTAALREVRQAWIERDAFTSDQAMRDGLVRTYAARCIVESTQMVATDASVKDSAAGQLREAIKSPSSREAQAVAMMEIPLVATPEDVETLAAIAMEKSEAAVTAAAALGRTCGPEAAAAVKRVVASYATDPLSGRINAAVEGAYRSRVLACPSGIEEQNLRREILKAASQSTQPSATQVRGAVAAPTAKIAAKTLLLVECSVATDDTVEEMLGAWKDRDSPRATPVTRDPLVRAIMAHCVLSSSPRPGVSAQDRTAAADLLRAAIRSQDAMTVFVAMQGLSRTRLQSDLLTVAEVPRRMPALRSPAIWAVSSSCADANAALAELRDSAATIKQREAVDQVFKDFAMGRNDSCGRNAAAGR